MNRTQTCGPQGSFGKCLVEATGGNICAAVILQTDDCAECESDEVCILATGGGDRCNNGANGMEFICARPL